MKRCDACGGSGWATESRDGFRSGIACLKCRGRGDLPVTPQEVRKRAAIIRSETLTSALQPVALIVINLPPKEAAS